MGLLIFGCGNWMKVNLLSPDIYEIEDFITVEEQEEVLSYCQSLNEQEWWQSEDEEYKKSFFYGKQKIGELPEIFNKITNRTNILFSDFLYIGRVALQRHPGGNFMQPHIDYWNKKAEDYVRFGLVIYYNDEYEGGEIRYPEINLTHKPKARSLVMHGGNILHGTKEVTSDGYRYFSTSFVRGSVNKPVILNQETFSNVEQSDGSAYP